MELSDGKHNLEGTDWNKNEGGGATPIVLIFYFLFFNAWVKAATH